MRAGARDQVGDLTLVVAGHGFTAPEPAEAVANAVACLRPTAVILGTCYSASTELLQRIAVARPGTPIVATTYKLPYAGFNIPDDVETLPPLERLKAVSSRSGRPVERFVLTTELVSEAEQATASASTDDLRARVIRRLPTLVATTVSNGATLLVRVPEERVPRVASR